MKITSIILFFTITLSINAGGVIWNSETLSKQAKESQIFFKGKIKSYEQTYFLQNRATKKKTLSTKKEAIKLYKSYLDGTKSLNNIEDWPSVKFKTEAIIEVKESIRGYYKKGDTIKLEWEDLYDSMCPHPETAALDQKVYIWFERHDHTKEKADLSVLPIEKEKELLEAFATNQKKKEEAQQKHLAKVNKLLKALEKSVDEEKTIDYIIDLQQFDDDIVEHTLIKRLESFKGSKELLEEHIWSLASILARKKKTHITNLKLTPEIKTALKKEIEIQIEQ